MSESRVDLRGRLDELKARAKKAAPVVGLVAVAGLTASYLQYDFPFRPLEKTTQAPPRTLPPAVKQYEASALKVYDSVEAGLSSGSGVKVGPRLALTAAHVVLGINGTESPQCGHLVTQNRYSRGVNTDRVTNVVIGYGGKGNLNSPDIALLKIAGDPAFDKIPAAPLATQTPKKGQVVYFVNYEPNPVTGLDRLPSGKATPLAYSLDSTLPGKAFYDTPAEYAGIVVGHQGSMLEIATGLQGYGPAKGMEKDSHHGGSGGPIENSAGQVVGLADYDSINPKRAQFLDDWHLIRLPVPFSHDIGVTFAQPITQNIVNIYQRYLGEHPIC